MKKFLNNLKEKCVKENKLILLFLLLILFFIIINIIINRINIKNNEIITENLYTMSDESIEKISKISDEDEIKIYLFDYEENDYAYIYAKKYEELNKNISVEIKKIGEDEELVNQYGIKEGEYSILIVSGEKSQLLDDEDLYSYDYNTGDIINLVEHRLTNGIIDVSSNGEKKPLYILKGHEKYAIDSELSILKRYIELENYEIKELKIADDDIPEDCNILLISSINSDFSDEETDKIKDYISNGGNIIWLEDARFGDKEYNNEKSIFEMYGLQEINSGAIFEQEKNNTIMQNPYLILPKINNTEILGDFVTQGKVMFYYSTKLNFVEDEKLKELNVTKTELLSTSENAIFKTDFSEDTMNKKEGDEEGTFIVGALLEKSLEEGKISKLIIYANNYFVTNNAMKIGKEEIPVADLYNNVELIQDSINYLNGNSENITIRKIVPRDYYLGIENQSLRQARIVELIILAVVFLAVCIIKRIKK